MGKPCVCFYDRNFLDNNYDDIDMTKVVHQKVFLCDGCCVKKLRNVTSYDLPPPSKDLYVDESSESDEKSDAKCDEKIERKEVFTKNVNLGRKQSFENETFEEKSDIDMTNVVHPKEQVEQRGTNRNSYRSSFKSQQFDKVSNDSGVYDEICEAEVKREMEELKKRVVIL